MPPRIVSLLPSATEALFAMGAGDQVVAVSHACTLPEGADPRPAAVRTRVTEQDDQAAIDAQVHELLEAGEPLHIVDEGVLHHVQPDVIIAQETCEVCGAGPADVHAALMRIEPADRPEVLTLHAHGLEGALEEMVELAQAAGVEEAGRALVTGIRDRLDEVRALADQRDERPAVAVLDWLDPPMAAGHWVPELVELAGGQPVLVEPGEPSRYVEVEEVAGAAPKVLVAAPCGLGAKRARTDVGELVVQDAWQEVPAVAAGRVHAVDGDRFFSRPGPSLATTAELLALAIDPATFEPQFPEHRGLISKVR